jgi:hypothetical protein
MDTTNQTLTADQLKEQAAKLQEQAVQMERDAREKANEEAYQKRLKAAQELEILKIKENGPKLKPIADAIQNILGITLDSYSGSHDKVVNEVANEFGHILYKGKYGRTSITLMINPIVHRANGSRYGTESVIKGPVGMRAEWYSDRRYNNKLYSVKTWDKALEHFIKKATELKTREDGVLAAEKAQEVKKKTNEEAIRACFEGTPYDVKIEQNYSYTGYFRRGPMKPMGTFSVTLYKPGTYERVLGYLSVWYNAKENKVMGTVTQSVDIKEHYHANH